MELTFTESMKDKGARLMSTPFSEIVDEATSELLLSPDYGRIMMLCDSVNQSQKDYNTDAVRAVRRRIDHKIPKVQYFTVVVIESLIKNCGPGMHAELAETKGLQRDLIAVALRDVSRDGEGEAKDVALQLILDCSHWFRKEVATEKTKALGEMINYVNKAKGGHGRSLFEGREPDTGVNINRVEAPKASREAPDRNASARSRQQKQQAARQAQAHTGAKRGHQGGGPVVVDAIPIIPPTEQEISGMMDAVMLLVEALNAAEESKASVDADDMVKAISTEVRSQHRHLSLLISSGAELEGLEVLLSITDSQVGVIQRLSTMLKNQGQMSTANRIAQDAGLPPHSHDDEVPAHLRQPQPAPQGPVHPAPAPPPNYAPAPQVTDQQPPDIEALMEQSRQSQQYSQPAPAGVPPPAGTSFQQQQPAVPIHQQEPAPIAPTPAHPVPVHNPQPVVNEPVAVPAPVVHQRYDPPPVAAYDPTQTAAHPYQQPPPVAQPQPVVPQAQAAPPAPTIDDLFGDPTPAHVVSAPAPPPPTAPAPRVHDDLWGSPAFETIPDSNPGAKEVEMTEATPAEVEMTDVAAPAPPAQQHGATRSAADIDAVFDEAPPYSAEPAPAPAPVRAFPAPHQQLDPSKVETKPELEQMQQEPAVHGSLNGGGDDEFDAFLNNRLGA